MGRKTKTNKRVVVIIDELQAELLRNMLDEYEAAAIRRKESEDLSTYYTLVGAVDSAIDLSGIIYKQNGL